MAWDPVHGGVVYGNDREGGFYDEDKYFWVQAEAIATAALLAARSGDEVYRDRYRRLGEYSWTHFVDHAPGAWHRIPTRAHPSYSDEKGPAGTTEYPAMGACYEVLNVLPEGG